MTKKHVFVASLASETNTFSPLPTDIQSFREGFWAPAGTHPSYPTLCSAPFTAAREHAKRGDWKLAEGSAHWAEPGGLITKDAYETLRDTILAEVKNALPLDGILLGLHGAMIADGYEDCEGDLLRRLRALVGGDIPIMAEFDLHLHLTRAKLEHLNLFVAFKEFPHTDFLERARDLTRLAADLLNGKIRPVFSVFDCRMVEVMPTSHEPMKSFINKVKKIEDAHRDLLCISVCHGFMAADVPEVGCKILVMTDNNRAKGDRIARELGEELFSLRGQLMMPVLSVPEGLERADANPSPPTVLADMWDNPGGGVPGDSTFLLHAMLEHGVQDAALASIWDPRAVQTCRAAGEGSRIRLAFGGHSCDLVGEPVKAQVLIKKIQPDAWQSFGESKVSLGTAVVLEVGGTEVILCSHRTQTYSPDVFSNLGIDPAAKRLLVVKSTNHFYAAFSKLTPHILHVSARGCYPSDPKKTNYKNLRRPLWPIDDLSWSDVLACQKDF